MVLLKQIRLLTKGQWLLLLFLLPAIAGAQNFSAKVLKEANCADEGGEAMITGIIPEAHSVKWVKSGRTVSTSAKATDLKSGSYNVSVILKACDKEIFKQSVYVKKKAGFKVNIGASGGFVKKCDDPMTGGASLSANIINGDPSYKYEYKWTGGSTSSSTTVKKPGTYTCVVTINDKKCGVYDKISIWVKKVECSKDPNDITGPEGFGEPLFVGANERMHYAVRFENDPVFASAPAKKVIVTLPLHDNIKLNSFQLGDIGFGSFNFSLPSNTAAHTQLFDVVDSLGVYVRLTAGINVVNHEAFWIFESIDPATGTNSADALLGFLLVNDSIGRGEGFINFSYQPSDNAVTGDTITAKAEIVFDENAPIETNLWLNTVDAIKPLSEIINATPDIPNGELKLWFNAEDDPFGSGIKDVSLFVAENNGAYEEYGKYHPDSSLIFSGTNGNIYYFMSIAEDNVGNMEDLKALADYKFDLSTPPSDIELSNNFFDEFAAPGTIIGMLTSDGENSSNVYSYNLVNGEGDTDNQLFEINGDTLFTAAEFLCLPDTSYNIRINTTNQGGLEYQKQFTIYLLNVYNEQDTIDEYIEFCDGTEIDVEGIEISCSGEYILSLTNRYGCDSIVRLHAYTLPAEFIQIDTIICDNETYIFNNIALTTSGVYLDTFTNDYGCDSIVELNLNIVQAFTSTEQAEICNGDTYIWQNKNLNLAGTYSDTLTSKGGCDSIINLELSALPKYEFTDKIEICEGIFYNWQGKMLGTTGFYSDTLLSTNACDSIINLELNVVPEFKITEQIEICAGTSYNWQGIEINDAGSYTDTLLSSGGCDSIILLELTVNPIYNEATQHVGICDGNSYNWQDKTISGAGMYSDTLVSSGGCDSIIHLELSVNPIFEATVQAEICEGNSFSWQGKVLSIAGTYSDTLISASNCDSILHLELTVNPVYESTQQTTICEGTSFSWRGKVITDEGEYADTLTSITGCDSIFRLSLGVVQKFESTEHTEICAGTSFNWFGNDLSAAGTYTHTLISTGGCDSIVKLELTLVSEFTVAQQATICEGSSYTWLGRTLMSAGTYSETLISAGGCDSTINLTLTVSPSHSILVWDTITAGESYLFNGNPITQAGSYTATHTNQFGCDSVITLNFNVQALQLPSVNNILEDIEIYNNDTLSTSIDLAKMFNNPDNQYLQFAYLFEGGLLPSWITSGFIDSTLTLDFKPEPADTGCYTITIMATIPTGQSVTDSFQLCVVKRFTGVNDIEKELDLKLYPNPTKGKVTLEIKGATSGKMELTVIDLSGRQVLQESYLSTPEQVTLDISKHKSGIYVVIIDIQGKQISKKIILDSK